MNNRKEIAARLLERGELLDQEDTASMRTALIVIDRTVGGPSGYKFSPLFERLADLIDPTCEDASESSKDGFTSVPVFKCSKCGCQHISPEYVRYCPNCGSRVVR